MKVLTKKFAVLKNNCLPKFFFRTVGVYS